MQCIDWIDRESNRCCVYIALHLVWVCCVSTIRTYEPNDDDDRMFHVRFCSFFLLLFFCYSLAFHSFSVIRFFSTFVRPFVILFRSYFESFFQFSFHSVLEYVVCVCVRHLFFVIMPGAAMTASSRAAWWLCVPLADALLPSPRGIFIFVSHSIRVVGYSIQCCSLDTFSRSLAQHCMCGHMGWKRTTWTHTISSCPMFWARLVRLGSFGGVCRWVFFFFLLFRVVRCFRSFHFDSVQIPY